MGRKYKNPPVVEALCEFQFIPNQPWDMTIPGLMYEKIKTEFPDKQEQIGINIQSRPTEKGLEQKIEPAPLKIQFFKKDKSALVQLAPNLLVINCLKPYPSWEEFKSLIIKKLEVYREITNPKGFKRIGLRYINIFEFNKPQIELKDYFRYYPPIPDTLPQNPSSFLTKVELPVEKGHAMLIISLRSAIPNKPDSLSILLDIDYAMVTPEHILIQDISNWLEKAHQKVEDAFEGCITDKARELFEGEK